MEPTKLIEFPTKSFKRIPIIEKAKEIGPIEAKMQLILSRIKNSKYEDTFDWSIYDKIAARYGENQPRGGVIFNTTLKLVNHHSSCAKCHYAFEVDTYGRGCVHNCIYCYAKESLTRHGYWNEPMPFPVNIAEIRRIFYTVFETTKVSKWRDILEKRVPLRIGSMSDSFMWMDRKYGVTKELLKILSYYNYPYIIFTRSDLIATDEYLKLLRKDLCSVQISISGENEYLTKLIEPGAPSVERRLKTLRILSENKIWTTVRMNPLFPHKPDGYYTDSDAVAKRFGSKANCPEFNLFTWDFPKIISETGCTSILAGVVRLTPFAIRAMTKATGIEFSHFFNPSITDSLNDKHFSDSEIAFYYTKLRAECLKVGVRFNTCYIGNGDKDFYQYQNLWDNKLDCCDAKGNVAAISSSSQDIPWSQRIVHAPCKTTATQNQEMDVASAKLYSSTTSGEISPSL